MNCLTRLPEITQMFIWQCLNCSLMNSLQLLPYLKHSSGQSAYSVIVCVRTPLWTFRFPPCNPLFHPAPQTPPHTHTHTHHHHHHTRTLNEMNSNFMTAVKLRPTGEFFVKLTQSNSHPCWKKCTTFNFMYEK